MAGSSAADQQRTTVKDVENKIAGRDKRDCPERIKTDISECTRTIGKKGLMQLVSTGNEEGAKH
jgi:hypothetical protein